MAGRFVAEGRLWRQIRPELFRFSTTDRHDLHIALMLVFDEAAILQPALAIDDVRRGLATLGWDGGQEETVLADGLRQLTEWGLLEATQDQSARYSTPEEFERRNLRWSVTPSGQAAVAGMIRAIEVLRQTVSLQPAVLDAIADALDDLERQLSEPASADSRITTRLSELERHHESLVGNVRQLNSQLQRLLREDATSDDVFLEVKRRTVSYLEEYITDVERPARRLATSIQRLESERIAEVHRRALRGANLAPFADSDPAAEWLAERQRRWQALLAWFSTAGGAEPRIRILTGIAREAIVQLLRVLEQRFEGRRRSASAAADFRALARWFAAAESEEDAHRLFNAAFGLSSARHAHVIDDTEREPASTSWRQAVPVTVAPILRVMGRGAPPGRPTPVVDPSGLRAQRQREQAEALLRQGALRAQLITDGQVPLSSLGYLPPELFHEFLILLSEALSAPVATDGTRRATSVDAQVEIALHAPDQGKRASLVTREGALDVPDYGLEVVLTTERRARMTTLAEVAAGG